MVPWDPTGPRAKRYLDRVRCLSTADALYSIYFTMDKPKLPLLLEGSKLGSLGFVVVVSYCTTMPPGERAPDYAAKQLFAMLFNWQEIPQNCPLLWGVGGPSPHLIHSSYCLHESTCQMPSRLVQPFLQDTSALFTDRQTHTLTGRQRHNISSNRPHLHVCYAHDATY